MTSTTYPQHGDVIVFDRVPTGSYCSEGVAYRVDRKGNTGRFFRFENVERGSATNDPKWAVAQSSWRKA